MADDGPKRKLATIVAMDVVGYSKLMADDEEATLRTLTAYREIVDRLIARHDGTIFNAAGDSVLADFGSAVEAVRCALTIQDELRTRNAELIPERQMLFRIGINVGDVLVSGDDRFGDGVNVAARLESIAEPGGVCISGSTFEQVKNKLSVGFTDLGAQQVKNIPEPVAAFGIISAPVRVHGGAHRTAPASNSAASAAPAKASLKWVWAVVAVVVIAVGAGIGYWQLARPGAKPLSSFPENISTSDMKASELASFVIGMKIRGERVTDGQPFTVTVNPDHTVLYEFERTGAQAGTYQKIVGKWWVEDFHFCMQIRGFAFNEPACPVIEKHGSKLGAKRPKDGQPLPWKFSK